MNPENSFLEPVLEQAVSEIRDENIGEGVIEAAAVRVWSRVAEAAAQPNTAEHIRGCADFQALIPDFRTGNLTVARAMLLQDHLHECVACRRAFEGKVVTVPAPRVKRQTPQTVRWAIAAVVVAAAGLSIWVAVDQYGTHTGRAIVQAVNGQLYEVSAEGIRPLLVNQDFPDGVEIRTAKDSGAMLQLRDGSQVELRERSGLSTSQTSSNLTIHLLRGSVIVQAAKRRTGHLVVATADCRVSVTGTIFGVSAGVKGSRVSVIQGEVHVIEDNAEKVLHPGGQSVTSADLEPESVHDDIAWSRNHDRYFEQLAALRAGLQQLPMPHVRYASRLLDRLPASTVFVASIPNLADYLGQAQNLFQGKMDESPELRHVLNQNLQPVIERLRAASEYLGDEIVVAGLSSGPVLLAETKRDGFAAFLNKQGLPLAVETRGGLVAFGPNREAVAQMAAALNAPSGGFAGTPFYARIAQAYREGAGILLCADLSRLGHQPLAGVRYLIANEQQSGQQIETSASLSFDGPRTGIAAWLAEPAPMGALDYISPAATVVSAFVVQNPASIVDQVTGVANKTPADIGVVAAGVENDLARSLGGEFAIALDGPAFPVPAWKLVIEVYDANRVQAALQRLVEQYNQEAAAAGGTPIRTSQEVVDGRTYYMLAGGDPNPLTEAHYTFADGYLIAGPTRALVTHALQVKTSGTSIARSTKFVSMMPRDHHANFSAVLYQNLGTTLAPLTGLLGAFAPNQNGRRNPLANLGDMKPSLLAAYGEPDQLTVAGNGDVLGGSLTSLAGGNILGMAGNALPFLQPKGTQQREHAYHR